MEHKILKKLFIFLVLIPIFVKAQNLPFLITEIMYNPEGNDSDREWLEVYNQSNQTFYLKSGRSGWRINDGENHLFKDEITIYPQEVFVIVQDKNKFLSEYPEVKTKIVSANFSLKNTSAKIQIFDENKNLIGEISYQNSCGGDGNGYSIIFKNGLCYENKIKKGSPGIYPEGLKEEAQELLLPATTSQANLQLTPSTSSNENQQLQPETTSTNYDSSSHHFAVNDSSQEFATTPTLYISEFLPNPQGNDYGQEFVEIYNYGEKEINLDGFILEIGKKRIKLKGIIEPKEYFVINNKDYNFSIRNQGESLALYFQDQKIFSIDYQGKAPEGKSFSRFESKWYFTEPTPGRENRLILTKNEDKALKVNQENLAFAKPRVLIDSQNSLATRKRDGLFIAVGSLLLIFFLSILVLIFL